MVLTFTTASLHSLLFHWLLHTCPAMSLSLCLVFQPCLYRAGQTRSMCCNAIHTLQMTQLQINLTLVFLLCGVRLYPCLKINNCRHCPRLCTIFPPISHSVSLFSSVCVSHYLSLFLSSNESEMKNTMPRQAYYYPLEQWLAGLLIRAGRPRFET